VARDVIKLHVAGGKRVQSAFIALAQACLAFFIRHVEVVPHVRHARLLHLQVTGLLEVVCMVAR